MVGDDAHPCPAARAAATSSTAVIAQSAVISSRVPRSASRATVAVRKARSRPPCGSAGTSRRARPSVRSDAHQDRRRADAVAVVVAVDGDAGALANVCEHELGRGVAARRTATCHGARRPRGSARAGAGSRSPRRTSTCAIQCETPSSRREHARGGVVVGGELDVDWVRHPRSVRPRRDGTERSPRNYGASQAREALIPSSRTVSSSPRTASIQHASSPRRNGRWEM